MRALDHIFKCYFAPYKYYIFIIIIIKDKTRVTQQKRMPIFFTFLPYCGALSQAIDII